MKRDSFVHGQVVDFDAESHEFMFNPEGFAETLHDFELGCEPECSDGDPVTHHYWTACSLLEVLSGVNREYWNTYDLLAECVIGEGVRSGKI